MPWGLRVKRKAFPLAQVGGQIISVEPAPFQLEGDEKKLLNPGSRFTVLHPTALPYVHDMGPCPDLCLVIMH